MISSLSLVTAFAGLMTVAIPLVKLVVDTTFQFFGG